MPSIKQAIVAGVAYLSLMGQAHASFVTDRVDFVASDFTSSYGVVTPPTDPVSGSFEITLDPYLYQYGTVFQDGIRLNAANVNLANAVGFIYYPGAEGAPLKVGTIEDGGSSLGSMRNTNSFFLMFATLGFPLATHDNGGVFYYSQNGIDDRFMSTHVNVTVTDITGVSPVPIPPTLPMFASIIGCMLGAAYIHRRRAALPSIV